MQRFQITLDVSMFAYHQEDAEHLSRILRDRVEALLGGGQAIVKASKIEPVTGDGLFNAPGRTQEFWLDAKLMISADDEQDAKQQLDEALCAWAARSLQQDRGLRMFDRTDLVREERK